MFIHQTAWKVHPRKSITAILHKPRPMGSKGVSAKVYSRMAVGWVAESKWPLLKPAHPAEKPLPFRGYKHISLALLVGAFSEVQGVSRFS
jgi:hypothetical protein